MFSRIIDILFPSTCHACGLSGAYVCSSCLEKCDKPSAFYDSTDNDWQIAIYSYKNPLIKKIIWDIKFHGKFSAAETFGPSLARAARSLIRKYLWNTGVQSAAVGTGKQSLLALLRQEIAIVPIPPSLSGEKKRGYNQTHMIARALLRHFRIAAYIETKSLTKIRATEKQAALRDRNIRLKNMDKAFVANPALTKDRIIMLVDDVTTTGATLKDARRALLEAGAKAVLAITIAH